MPCLLITWGTILFSAAILDSIERPTDGHLNWRAVLRDFMDQAARSDYSWMDPPFGSVINMD